MPRSFSSRSPRRSWSAFLLEVVSIVFGVLLALALNEWREQRSEDRMVATVQESLAGEVRSNAFFLEQRLPYYEAMATAIDSLQAVHGAEARLAGLRVPGFNGFNPPVLQSASYEAALAAQVYALMDFEQAAAISRLYTFQAFYLNVVDQYMSLLLAPERQTLGLARSAYREMGTVGRELLGAYREIAAVLPEPAEATP